MDQNHIFYEPSITLLVILFLLTVGLLTAIVLVCYVYIFAKGKGAKLFSLLMASISLWIIFKTISLFSGNPQYRFYISVFTIPTVTAVTLLFYKLAKEYTQTSVYKWLHQGIKISFVVLNLGALTTQYHKLFIAQHKIIYRFNIPFHKLTEGPLYTVWRALIYFTIFLTFGILIKRIIDKEYTHRKQLVVFLIGLLIPFFHEVLFVTGISLIPDYNLAPVFFSVGNLFIAWSFFGFELFEFKHFARNIITEKMADGLILTNHEHKIIDLNPAAENIFQLRKSQIIGKAFSDCFSEHKQLIEFYTINNQIQNRLTIDIKENTYSISFTNVSDTQGNVTGYIISTHDITALVSAQMQQLENEHKFQTIFKNASAAIVIISINGEYLNINDAFTKITGYTLADTKNKKIGELNLKEKDEITMINSRISDLLASGNSNIHQELKIYHKSGQHIWVNATAKKYYNQKGEFEYILAEFYDITNEKLAHEKELKLMSELKATNTVKDKLFSIIGHDLKSPFTTILGFLEMLHNEFDINPNKENKRLIHQIAETATETYALIEKLLNWAQTQTQQIQPKLIPTDIVKTCQTAQNIYKTRMAQKQIEFTYLGPEKYLLNTDENILQTILRNLLSNALKFTNPGGQIILTIVINPRHCQISVRDTGIGMPPEIANNLFVNVVNPIQYGTNRETGTGLGMAICKEFTDKLLGHIEVQSTLNHGTLFTVSLPN